MSRKLSAGCAAIGAIGLPPLAIAALPKSQAPSRGNGTNILQTIQNWGFDGFMLIGLIIVGVMFLGVGWHAFGVYHEIHDGKKKWRDLGATATVGVGILAVGIFLVAQATDIL